MWSIVKTEQKMQKNCKDNPNGSSAPYGKISSGKAKELSRDTRLDLIRIVAFFFVICVHSLLEGGFYFTSVKNWSMLPLISLRGLFIACVPLFLMLSGYLNCHKRLEKSYYASLGRIVGIYLLSCLACNLFSCWYYRESFDLLAYLLSVLDYSASGYGWYVHMYLGFFLLIPFLNGAWRDTATKKARLCLVLSAAAVTALPSLFNTYNFLMDGWWALPSSSNDYQQLLPRWWQVLYPFTYYFMGAYLREYPPKKRPWRYLAATLGLVVIWGAYNYYRSRGTSFVWEDHVEYFSYQALTVALGLFCLFLSIDANRLPLTVRRILSYISSLTFGAYLTSWIFDTLSYPLLEQNVYYIPDRFKYYPVCIVFSAVGALFVSAGIDIVIRIAKAAFKRINGLFRRNYE